MLQHTAIRSGFLAAIIAVFSIVFFASAPAFADAVHDHSGDYTASGSRNATDGRAWDYNVTQVVSGRGSHNLRAASVQLLCLSKAQLEGGALISTNPAFTSIGGLSKLNVSPDAILWKRGAFFGNSPSLNITLDQVYSVDPMGALVTMWFDRSVIAVTVPGPTCQPEPPAQTYSISGFVFSFDGTGFIGLADWTITLSSSGQTLATSVTGSDGSYAFLGLSPGTYEVCEIQQPGWQQLEPTTETGCHRIELPDSRSNDGNATRDFLNAQL